MTSTTGSATTGDEALLKKVEALEQEVAALTAAVRRARTVRLLLLLAALAFVAGAVWMFYGLIMRFQSKENLDLLAEKAKQRLTASSAQYQRDVQSLVDKCLPVLRDAFAKRVEADMPKYSAVLSKEFETFVSNMEAKLTDQITAQQGRMADRFKGIVQQEFPTVNNPEAIDRLNHNIDLVMKALVKKYYADEMRREIEAALDTWEHFEPAPLPGKDEPSLAQIMIGNLLELVALKLSTYAQTHSEGGDRVQPVPPQHVAADKPKAEPTKAETADKGKRPAAKGGAAKEAKAPPPKEDAASAAKTAPPKDDAGRGKTRPPKNAPAKE